MAGDSAVLEQAVSTAKLKLKTKLKLKKSEWRANRFGMETSRMASGRCPVLWKPPVLKIGYSAGFAPAGRTNVFKGKSHRTERGEYGIL